MRNWARDGKLIGRRPLPGVEQVNTRLWMCLAKKAVNTACKTFL